MQIKWRISFSGSNIVTAVSSSVRTAPDGVTRSKYAYIAKTTGGKIPTSPTHLHPLVLLAPIIASCQQPITNLIKIKIKVFEDQRLVVTTALAADGAYGCGFKYRVKCERDLWISLLYPSLHTQMDTEAPDVILRNIQACVYVTGKISCTLVGVLADLRPTNSCRHGRTF